MCQVCYDKGFSDYPTYNTSVAHIEDYKRGYKARQNESLDADELQHTFFCEKCYDRGLSNSKIGIWCPPVSTKRGHYESYEKGYNQVEMEEANKIPEYYLPEDESARTTAPASVNKNMYVVAAVGVAVIFIAALVIFKFMRSPRPSNVADTVVAVTPPPAVLDTTPKPQEQPKQEAPQPEQKPTVEPAKPEPAPAQQMVKQPAKPQTNTEVPRKQPGSAAPKPDKLPPVVKKEPVAAPPAKTEASDGAQINTNKALSAADLKGLNKQQLKLMRNEIFARHGYIFKSPELNNYFRQKPWYKPQHEDVNGLLSPEERENVELIKKLER